MSTQTISLRLQLASAVILMLAALALTPTGAGAAAVESRPLNLITSPLPINISTEPGKAVTTELKVKQNSGGDERLQVSLMKFGAFGEEGKPRLMERQAGDDYFNWVTFDKSQFAAPNNVWQTVKMTVNVPKTAAFGYYYAVVFSRVGDDKSPGGNVQAIHGGSAVLVLLEAYVPGAKREVEVESITSKKGVYEFLPAEFSVKLHNTGNVHVVPHGNIFIMKGDKQVAVLNLNEEQGNILPGSKRSYPVEWKDSFPHFEKVVEDGKVKIKDGKPALKIVWNNGDGNNKGFNPHLRMGKYTAHLVAVYDDGQRDVPIEAEVSFWVVPWKFFLYLLLGIFVLYLIIRFALYRYKQHILEQVKRHSR